MTAFSSCQNDDADCNHSLHGCYGEATPCTLAFRLLPHSALFDEGEPVRLKHLRKVRSRWRRAIHSELRRLASCVERGPHRAH